jgi:hypothetical protein
MTEHTLTTADFAAAPQRAEQAPQPPTEAKPMPHAEATPVTRTDGGPVTRADGGPGAHADAAPIDRQPADRAASERNAPLFAGDQSEDFRRRWGDVQTSFVDEPRRAVEQADALVAEVMQRLAQVFADERSRLEQQWDREGGSTDTEALRQALRRYRSFFDRLLAM